MRDGSKRARSSSLESIDHQALQTRRQHPPSARGSHARPLGQAFRAPLRAAVADRCGARAWQTGGPAPVPAAHDARRTRARMSAAPRKRARNRTPRSPRKATRRRPKKDEPRFKRGQPPRDLRPGRRFAVELVGEGGQEMTGHAAKAVARYVHGRRLVESCEEIDLSAFILVCRGVREVLLSGYGRVYSRRSCRV